MPKALSRIEPEYGIHVVLWGPEPVLRKSALPAMIPSNLDPASRTYLRILQIVNFESPQNIGPYNAPTLCSRALSSFLVRARNPSTSVLKYNLGVHAGQSHCGCHTFTRTATLALSAGRRGSSAGTRVDLLCPVCTWTKREELCRVQAVAAICGTTRCPCAAFAGCFCPTS